MFESGFRFDFGIVAKLLYNSLITCHMAPLFENEDDLKKNRPIILKLLVIGLL